MRQFLEIKERHGDAILLFRCGDFYEMFFEDAVVASKALDLTLTSRDKGKEDGVPMAGVPYHAVVYWTGDARRATVSGYGDARLSGDALAPGWHLTPAGRFYGMFARELWRGEVVGYTDEGGVQTWTVRQPDGSLRAGALNATGAAVERTLTFGGTTFAAALGPRSGAVYATAGEVARVELGDQ